MQQTEYRRLHERVLFPQLAVASGVYSVLDPSITLKLNARGEYEHVGLNAGYEGPAEDLLFASSVGGTGPDEDRIAEMLFPESEDVRVDPVLGHYRSLYAGFVREGTYREGGSSGGLTTWLLCELLESGRIDGAIHVKPTGASATLFEYRVSTTAEEMREGAGSRYYPAEFSRVFADVKARGGRYAITAIPSFAHEVRLLQQLRPEWKSRIPYVIGLICGHQKTSNYASQLAWSAGISPTSVSYIDFRKKIPGRPASQYVTEIHSGPPGAVEVSVWENLFGTDWGWGLFKSNFSDFTEDAFNETADVVMGDAWLPQYVGDSRGTNVLIVRNQEINELITHAAASGRLELETLDPPTMIRSQSALVRHAIDELPVRRDLARSGDTHVPPMRKKRRRSVHLGRRLIQRRRLALSRGSTDLWITAVAEDDLSSFRRQIHPLVDAYRRAQKLSRFEDLLRNPSYAMAIVRKRIARLTRRR